MLVEIPDNKLYQSYFWTNDRLLKFLRKNQITIEISEEKSNNF